MVTKKKAAKGKTTRKKAGKKTSKRGVKKKSAKKASKKLTPIPEGYTTITASLKQRDAQATLDFVQKAFGAKARSIMPGPDGTIMHAQVKIGTSLVHLANANHATGPAIPSNLFVYVKNVDETVAKAVAAGAKVVMPADNMFWGDRYAVVADEQGNTWEIGSRFEIVSPAQMKKRMQALFAQAPAADAGHE